MESSILISTKKVLGLDEAYDVFDLDVMTHINATFGILNQMGICPDGYAIDSELDSWDELNLPQEQLNLVKTYVFLRVKMLFDTPQTSFLIDATNKQLDEVGQRLSYFRETSIPFSTDQADRDRITSEVPSRQGGWDIYGDSATYQ